MFRAMAGYFVGAWLLLQVANVTFPPLGLPDWMQRALIYALAAGIVPAFVLAWIYDFTAHGIVRTANADASHEAAAATDSRALASSAAPRSDGASVAVLPFADLSAEKDQDWFCDGLAEEIIDALACVRGLRVASRTSSFRFRDGSVDPVEIGERLRVGAVLEGSVRKSGEHIRVTAQLIDAGSGFHLWSEKFDRRLEDIFAIQSEIATKVAAALRLSLTGEAASRNQRYAPRNLQAHEFYLRGRQLVAKINVADWRLAVPMFRRAIELDPEYAQAHAGLADILAQMLLWRFELAEDVLPEATRAAQRAMELAPDLAEVHVALAHVRSLTGDREGATRAFEHALQMNPDLFEACYYYARHCYAHGDHARAAELFLKAFALRPDDFTIPVSASDALDTIGEHARAQALRQEAMNGLQHHLELYPNDARGQAFMAILLQRGGRTSEAIPHVETALRADPDNYATLYNAACFYSLAGDSIRALDLLERASAQGGGSRGWLEHDNDLASLREMPRFKALMERLNQGPAMPV